MKRIFATVMLASAAAWILAIPAAAQDHGQGHPGGGAAAGGSMGASGSHGNGEGHGSSSLMASTNPGRVLEHNSNLAGKLETLTNTNSVTDLEADAKAFKNLGQFVAAAHVAKNLNIPGGFAALMCDMTTKTAVGATSSCTNTTKMSLGKAIQALDPNADAKSESKKAVNQANQDVKDSSGS